MTAHKAVISRTISILLAGMVALAVALAPTIAQTSLFLETFSGTPPAPAAWHPTNWDVTVLGQTRDLIEPMQAMHGVDCAPPPATHTISQIEDTVFICRDHLMTAMNAGYGAVYLTPNQIVDFSTVEAVVKFDMSTLRTSPRDWVDLLITPFNDNLQISFDASNVGDSTAPRYGVRLEMQGENVFKPTVYRNFIEQAVPWVGPSAQYDTVLTPSASRRDTFELDISRTHIRFGMPAYNLWWTDAIVPDLGWSQGVIQLTHRSYNPNKACDFNGTCGPDTWHWDNVSISPAAPFTILRADRRYVDNSVSPAQINLASPIPLNAHLRFAAVGSNVSFSVDDGKTWTLAQRQGQTVTDEHFQSYWTPVPAGITRLLFRGNPTWAGDWLVQDIAVWAADVSRTIWTEPPDSQDSGADSGAES